ncbi:uncharacterized protein KIAA2026 [Patella vulgata]|uniref:uncharacterized protein KIAA2026 n=1 Tax=Patella vulgata TaxID=6465 RepID=UPI00218058B1|nr:uncharacterized protein KIAA2026 [Patella vulgata]
MEKLEDTSNHTPDSQLTEEKVNSPKASELNLETQQNYEFPEVNPLDETSQDTYDKKEESVKGKTPRKREKIIIDIEDGQPPLSDELKNGYRILRELMSDSNKAVNWPFMEAVDDSHPDTADYYEVVDNPMWLKRMREKFDKRLYDSITLFVSDFRVMLENCYRYNGPDHFISKRGQRLEMMLEQKLALLSRELREKTSVAATTGGKVEESFSSGMRRRVKSTYQRDTSALLSQLRKEEAQRGKDLRRQQILDRKAANEALVQEQLEWENMLLKDPIKSQMNGMWELPQIGHFLFLCQEPLNIGEVPQFELERSFAMPRQSSCMQNVMTSLLSTQYQRTKLEKTGMMPYSVWTEKLYIKLAAWYKILADYGGDTYKAANKIGIDSYFFDVVGRKNPLLKKKFHDLSFYRIVWIVKSLCDHCLETQESIRDAIERQPIQEQREYLLGYDTKGNQYIHFPQFCGADLRIYRQEPFPEPEDSEEEIEEQPPIAKKKKLESPSKKLNSATLLKNNNNKHHTPDTSILRRSRRGQSEESSNSNNNSSLHSSSSKNTPELPILDDTSNDSASLPVPSSKHKRNRSFNNTPLLLDETSTDSASISISSSRRRKRGGKKGRKNGYAKNLKKEFDLTESECFDESTCSSLTECYQGDRNSEEKDLINKDNKMLPNDNNINENSANVSVTIKNESEANDYCSDSTQKDSELFNINNKTTKPDQEKVSSNIYNGANTNKSEALNNLNSISTSSEFDKCNSELVNQVKQTCQTSSEHICDNFHNKPDSNISANVNNSECDVDNLDRDSVIQQQIKTEPFDTDLNSELEIPKQVSEIIKDMKLEIDARDEPSGSKNIWKQNEGREIKKPEIVYVKKETDLGQSETCVKEKCSDGDIKIEKDDSKHILTMETDSTPSNEIKADENTEIKIEIKDGNKDEESEEKTEGSKGEIKEEKMENEEEEEEEELEPELGPFLMICDNVDDLRQLVDKYAEQEPIVMKRGKKEKIVQPPPRKKCIVDLHDRLAFLLNELEPWESKLNAAMRKARVKIRREFEDYVEEEASGKWESESETSSNVDSSDEENDSSEVEDQQDLSVKKEKPEPKEKAIKVEEIEIDEDDYDVSSRGRLRKRRIIPNNSEESIKKKKIIKKEEPVPSHVPNILRQVKSPVPGVASPQSLTLQPTSMGHTIAIRMANQPQTASQLLRMSVNTPTVRQVVPGTLPQKSTSHPVIQQLLSKQTGTKAPPTLINSSLLNLQTSKTGTAATSSSSQPRIQYVITNQQNIPPNKTKPQITNLASLPAGLLQQLIKNQTIKIQQNSKGETQLVLAAPIQLTTPMKSETSTSPAKGPLVITPTAVSTPGPPITSVQTTSSPYIVPLTTSSTSALVHSLQATSSNTCTTSTMLSPCKTSPVQKYASNVTVKALLENRAAKKPESHGTSTNSSTSVEMETFSPDQTNTDGMSPSKVVAKILQGSIPASSISTSLPTVNIKVPPPVTLPLIQPRKNITRTIQMINAPISVTTKLDKGKLGTHGVSSTVSSTTPITSLVNSSTRQTVIAHPTVASNTGLVQTVASKSGLILQTKSVDAKTILLQGQPTKHNVVPQNLLSSSPGIIQGYLTPQGLQIPSNMLPSSTGSVILQASKSAIAGSTAHTTTAIASSISPMTFSAASQSFQNQNSALLSPKPLTNIATTAAAGTPMMTIQPPGNYFIVQPGNKGPVQHVQLQKVAGNPNQIILGSGQAMPLGAVLPNTLNSTKTIQLKSPSTPVLQVANSVPKQVSKFAIPQNNTSTMPAANLVRQIAADQQKIQLPAGSKTMGVQILGQPGVSQFPQNMLRLPTGQLIQVPQGSIGVKSGSISNQDICLNQGLLNQLNQQSNIAKVTTASKVLPQTVLLSPSGATQGIQLTQNPTINSQQLLQQLQGLQTVRPVRPVVPVVPVSPGVSVAPAASVNNQQVQFHLNVTGNKLGLTSQPIMNILRSPAPTQNSVSSIKTPMQLQTPLSISIPNSTVVQSPHAGIQNKPIPTPHSSAASPVGKNSVSQQLGASKIIQVPLNPVDDGVKTHVVWPKGKKENPKMNSATKIVQLAVSDLQESEQDPNKVGLPSKISPEKMTPMKTSPTISHISVDGAKKTEVLGLKPSTESPGKQQKLLLYNIGGQLMTAQGVPVTVDQGVLKIVQQATIQIGSQTLTVRAPSAAQGDNYEIPVSVGGKSEIPNISPPKTSVSGKVLTTPLKKETLLSNVPPSLTNLISSVSAPLLDMKPSKVDKDVHSVSSFPYSISSKVISEKTDMPGISLPKSSISDKILLPETSWTPLSKVPQSLTNLISSTPVPPPDTKPPKVDKGGLSVSSFPYSISSKLVTTPFKNLTPNLTNRLQAPVLSTRTETLVQTNYNQNKPEMSTNSTPAVNEIVTFSVEKTTGYSTIMDQKNSNHNRETNPFSFQSSSNVPESNINCTTKICSVSPVARQTTNAVTFVAESMSVVSENTQLLKAQNNVSEISSEYEQCVTHQPTAITPTNTTVSNGAGTRDENRNSPLNAVQSPEKEAAKNLLALANQALLSHNTNS